MTTVLTMPRQMKGISLLLLIAFVTLFLPIGQYMDIYAEEDDERGFFDDVFDVCGALFGAGVAIGGGLTAAAGVGVVATTGWTGIGTVAGGGKIAGGVVAVGWGLKISTSCANNVIDSIFGN